MWACGKAGEQWLIAQHECLEVHKDRHIENKDIFDIEF